MIQPVASARTPAARETRSAGPGSFQFHLLSFEGPDAYARAGGIATRVSGLARALADSGFDTHLWFIGDPDLPPHETCGRLTLHRWCQWISRYHPSGVYDGEEGKRQDYARSLPPVVARMIQSHLAETGGRTIVLAEEWQTTHAVIHLDWLLASAGLRDRVTILWNANNLFGFDRIDWLALGRAARITTVSRYMRLRMWGWGVDAHVIPNGLDPTAFRRPTQGAVKGLHQRTVGRLLLSKVGRWDPDKRWLLAIDTVAVLKRLGQRPLLIARGGCEAHGGEVKARTIDRGLHLQERSLQGPGPRDLMAALNEPGDADIISLTSPLTPTMCRLLFRGSAVVLANSGHEPFGLVGLETMAVGGVACTGGTGEDYAEHAWNGLVLETNDPNEFVTQYRQLLADPTGERRVRRQAMSTARRYAWPAIVHRHILSLVHMNGRGRGLHTTGDMAGGQRPTARRTGRRPLATVRGG
ncbi:MAG: glycosyltransferase [Gemmatimonadales bacterium]|jgi:glycosyltransferase involved in cell wall biosynthesis